MFKFCWYWWFRVCLYYISSSNVLLVHNIYAGIATVSASYNEADEASSLGNWDSLEAQSFEEQLLKSHRLNWLHCLLQLLANMLVSHDWLLRRCVSLLCCIQRTSFSLVQPLLESWLASLVLVSVLFTVVIKRFEIIILGKRFFDSKIDEFQRFSAQLSYIYWLK